MPYAPPYALIVVIGRGMYKRKLSSCSHHPIELQFTANAAQLFHPFPRAKNGRAMGSLPSRKNSGYYRSVKMDHAKIGTRRVKRLKAVQVGFVASKHVRLDERSGLLL